MTWNIEHQKYPFDYWILDNFFDQKISLEISNNFLDYDDASWWNYNSPLENKKTMQDWRKFSSPIYKTFQYLCSSEFIEIIKKITKVENIYPDYGLHGGGLHIHKTGGNLNIHKDYSIHPKLNLQRKFNLIIYMTPEWDFSWGGGLEFWSHDEKNNKPHKLIKTVNCSFNRAVLFDTTQNSWHGLPDKLKCPDVVYRKSLAIYYLTDIDDNAEERYRALFVPREDQNTDEIIKLCENRSTY